MTDLCDILAEHGKPIILDCSVYPEAKDKILEAVNKGNDCTTILSVSNVQSLILVILDKI